MTAKSYGFLSQFSFSFVELSMFYLSEQIMVLNGSFSVMAVVF